MEDTEMTGAVEAEDRGPPRNIHDVARCIVGICRQAGITFDLSGEDLKISFEEIDWGYWPPMRRRLECLGGRQLVRFLEGQEGFKEAKRLRREQQARNRLEPRPSDAIRELAQRMRASL